MRILYITHPVEDYLSDSIFHGLVSLGHEVVDANRLWYMWEGNLTPETRQKLYGRGFTMFGALPGTDAHADRTDIPNKIKCRHFDLVIYGSIWRCGDHLDIVSSSMPRGRIVFLDGEDHLLVKSVAAQHWYFKRELVRAYGYINPIGFSIPKSKYRSRPLPKVRTFGAISPGDQSTYVFTRESDYYDDYGSSYFGVTRKKSGWDCLRHYEIMANRCLPLFLDLEKCHELTLHRFPKSLVLAGHGLLRVPGQSLADKIGILRRLAVSDLPNFVDMGRYEELVAAIFDYAVANLTTEAMAEYVLRTVNAPFHNRAWP